MLEDPYSFWALVGLAGVVLIGVILYIVYLVLASDDFWKGFFNPIPWIIMIVVIILIAIFG